MMYFPFTEYWWFYLTFTAFILLVLSLDLGVFHRQPHTVSFREATLWSAVWIMMGLAFNFALFQYASYKFAKDPILLALPGFDPQSAAQQVGLEFLTGYIIEKTLSLDNLFVFVVVFRFFGIPSLHQHRVLFYGILGALVFRSIFIALGSALLQYEWVIFAFGGFLILTGAKMLFASDQPVEPDKNPLVRLLRRFMPVSADLHGPRFFVTLDHVLHATPLFLTLLVVELSDIVFAIDSVPAIFAVTKEPLIVFTSNIFAILGLRSLYFLLANAVEHFSLLKYGLAFVLMFVGLKMVWLNDAFGGKFPIVWSLGIIGGLIAISIIASFLQGKLRLMRN